MIEWKNSERGFTIGRFRDRYNARCSIQESSLATENCIWLGCDETAGGEPARMHLTRDMVSALLPVLQHFPHDRQPARPRQPAPIHVTPEARDAERHREGS